MAGMSAGVQVEGLREFQRGLKKLAPEVDKALKDELKTSVAEPVADDARRRLPSKSGRARGSIRAGADAKGPYIAGGKRSVPYFGWLEFGSRKPRGGNPRTLGPWRGSGQGPDGGRGIYPAIAAHNDAITTGATAALVRARDALDI